MTVADVATSQYQVTAEFGLFIAGAILIVITAAAFAWFVLRHANRDSDGGGASDDGV